MLALTLVGALSVVGVLIGMLGFSTRAAFWVQGQSAPVVWSGILRIPERYLRDVHHAVARDPSAATMHVPTATGFIGLLLGFILHMIMPVPAAWLVLASAVTLGIGALVNIARRWTDHARRLSRGWYRHVSVALLLFAFTTGLAASMDLMGVQPGLPSYLLLGALMLFPLAHLSWGLAGGPLRHMLAGSLTLAFHPRPERFINKVAGGALRPLDLTSDRLGARASTDMSWNQLLNFDACIQCGKCEAACPAFAAGQPLNPKALIADLAVQANLAWTPYAGNPHPGQSTIRGSIELETLWACTTCRACVEVCPMLVEHVDAIVDLRRSSTLELGAVPARTALALAAIDTCGAQTDAPRYLRASWSMGLGVSPMTVDRHVDVLLWQGEGAFTPEGSRTLRALARIFTEGGIQYATLGDDEPDCGDLARRVGDERLFQECAAKVGALLGRYRFNRIVTPDPHVFHALRNEYPEHPWQVEHHSQTLNRLLQNSQISVSRRATKVTYHDPCYLARYNREIEAPRALLAALGLELVEMDRSRFTARCCGGGGGAPLADVPGRARIPDQRMADALATGVPVVAVACPGCAAMLGGVPGPAPEVRDLAELVLDALTPIKGAAKA